MGFIGEWLHEVFVNRPMIRSCYKGIPTAKAGKEIPWRPGYYLWPDGSERPLKPSRRYMRESRKPLKRS